MCFSQSVVRQLIRDNSPPIPLIYVDYCNFELLSQSLVYQGRTVRTKNIWTNRNLNLILIDIEASKIKLTTKQTLVTLQEQARFLVGKSPTLSFAQVSTVGGIHHTDDYQRSLKKKKLDWNPTLK